MSGLRSAIRMGGHISLIPTQFCSVSEVQRAATIIAASAAGLAPVKISQQDLLVLKERLIAASRANRFDDISNLEWRFVPWAFWHGDDRVGSDQKIVQAFLQRAAARKSPTWIKSLINAYLTRYPTASRSFIPISKEIQQLLDSGRWPTLEVWKHRHDVWKLFEPDIGPSCVAKHLLLEAKSCADGLQQIGLDRAIDQAADFNFLASAYVSALEIVRQNLESGSGNQLPIVQRLIDWSKPLGQATGVRYPNLLSKLAATLLLPWRFKTPAPEVREKIQSFLLQYVGDPRTRRGAWQAVEPAATEVLLRWLAGDTLSQFFELLSQTADDIWEYRKRFWTAYYRKGAITEAWFALGPRAQYLVRRFKQPDLSLSYGELHGAQANQSVLLMRLGDFIVAEWSHSGACRFWIQHDRCAPVLYRSEYSAGILRSECAFVQKHHASEYGTWQREISDYIRRETGITVSSSEWS